LVTWRGKCRSIFIGEGRLAILENMFGGGWNTSFFSMPPKKKKKFIGAKSRDDGEITFIE